MKSILKFLFIVAFTGFLFSCKKSSESTTSSYYVKANFDGTEKNFNTSATAMKSKLADSVYNLTITGVTETEEGAITLWSKQDDFVTGKTYTIEASNGSTNILSYVSPLGSSDAASTWTSTYSYGTVEMSFSCTITETTSTYVKGTFSGVIFQNIESSIVSKNVTSGSFYAKF